MALVRFRALYHVFIIAIQSFYFKDMMNNIFA